MRTVLPLLALLALGLAAVPAQAHGTFEAQELEIQVLSDEGSDAIEPYGGYDINAAFLGSAYDPALGDTVYVRLEAYGEISEATATMPWSLVVTYTANGASHEHRMSTTDGLTFEHDFATLTTEYEAEEHSLHVQRATLVNGAPKPGQPLTDLTVRSYWGDDLRDIAPGGIPVPFSGGAADLVDPTAIPGEGRLVEAPVPPPVSAYFGPLAASLTESDEAREYLLNVANGLSNGGQHVVLGVAGEAPGWDIQLGDLPQVILEGAGSGDIVFRATPIDPAAAPAVLELTSDIGGRTTLELRADGSLHTAEAALVEPAPVEPKKSPSASLAAMLALAAVAAARRRT